MQLCCAARNLGVRIFAILVVMTMRMNPHLILANVIIIQIVVQCVVFTNPLILILI